MSDDLSIRLQEMSAHLEAAIPAGSDPIHATLRILPPLLRDAAILMAEAAVALAPKDSAMPYGRAEILHAAARCVLQDRNATHGAPEDSFSTIARLWTARLGVRIQPHEVAIMMGDVKTARAWANPTHVDNWVDLAGYAACGGELAGDAS